MDYNCKLRSKSLFYDNKLRWSFQHPFWLTTNIYPIDRLAHPINLDMRRETLTFAKLFITSTVYKKYPKPHLTQHDIHILRELMDTAEFLMGTHTGYYIQEIKKIVQNESNWKSSFLVVPEPSLYSQWCQHLFLLASSAGSLPFSTGGASDVCYFFLFRCIYFYS